MAEDADLGGAALRLEQLPPGRLQAGEYAGMGTVRLGWASWDEHPARRRGREGNDCVVQTVSYLMLNLMGEV